VRYKSSIEWLTLAVHELDVVIADVPASEQVKVKAFNHRLGDCGTTFFGARGLGVFPAPTVLEEEIRAQSGPRVRG
jgi:hypothetical protein